MAKYTLLQIVQKILNDTNSDNVNSISDTVEAAQVASIVQDTYDALFGTTIVPELQAPVQLESLSDTDRPNYLQIPDLIFKVELIQYNYAERGDVDYRDLRYVTPHEFCARSSGAAADSNCTVVEDESGVKFNIFTNKNPQFWTSFDDKLIICDAYNSELETTLQKSKTLCWGQMSAKFKLEDTYTPPIDDNLFPQLIAESKSRAFIVLDGTANQKEEQSSRRLGIRSQAHKWKAGQEKPRNRFPNYGRNCI